MLANTILMASLASFSIAQQQLEPQVPSPTNTAYITGSVTYLERIALPDDAILTVSLDAFPPGDHISLSEVSLRLGGAQVPFEFSIPYSTRWINNDSTYGVRAEIRSGNRVLFESNAHEMVISDGNTAAHMTLVQAADPIDQPGMQIEDVKWELVKFENYPMAEGPKPYFILNTEAGAMGGHTGVNVFGGEYILNQGFIQIDPGVQTLIAGTDEQQEMERQFLRTLELANRVTIESGELYLWRGDRLLGHFRALEDEEDDDGAATGNDN